MFPSAREVPTNSCNYSFKVSPHPHLAFVGTHTHTLKLNKSLRNIFKPMGEKLAFAFFVEVLRVILFEESTGLGLQTKLL